MRERSRHFTNNEHHPRAAKQPPSRKQQQRQQLHPTIDHRPRTLHAPLSAPRGDSRHELDKLRLAMALCFPPISLPHGIFSKVHAEQALLHMAHLSPAADRNKYRKPYFSLIVNRRLPAGLHSNKRKKRQKRNHHDDKSKSEELCLKARHKSWFSRDRHKLAAIFLPVLD